MPQPPLVVHSFSALESTAPAREEIRYWGRRNHAHRRVQATPPCRAGKEATCYWNMSVGLAREHARLGRWTVHRMLVLSLILPGSLVLVSDCVLIVLGGVSAREDLPCRRGRSGTLTIVPSSPALGSGLSVSEEEEERGGIDRMCRVGESDRVRTVVGGDAVVVDHAAGVEGVAGLLAGAAAVQDPAVLPVPQQRRDFRFQGQGGQGGEKKASASVPFAGEYPTES